MVSKSLHGRNGIFRKYSKAQKGIAEKFTYSANISRIMCVVDGSRQSLSKEMPYSLSYDNFAEMMLEKTLSET
jgi:hypothetical protein